MNVLSGGAAIESSEVVHGVGFLSCFTKLFA